MAIGLNKYDTTALPNPQEYESIIDPEKNITNRVLKQQKQIIDKCHDNAKETEKYVVNRNEYV